MSAAEAGFRCAAASLERAESLAGSATNVRIWLLLEHVGPWGVTALLDARLPEGLGPALRQRAGQLGAKILLIRRFHSRPDTDEGLRVFAAYADGTAPRLEGGVLADPREALDVDLESLRRGGSSGLPSVRGPDRDLFLVCTNGRHDTCCAERGRPVARALSEAHPEQTWEVSHVGGDRFAANMVVLPHGLYYGRLEPDSAVAVAEAHLRGELAPEHLRGRSSYAMPVQAAEAFLRAELGLTGIDAVRLESRTVDGDLTTTTMSAHGATYGVTVRTTRSESELGRLTCKAGRPEPVTRHELIEISRA
ncbi:sucrase ferredoxin [Nocardioides sp. Kera G14]|uniref:sucrase ferredoxin n=1 Tax=Nocardioides sp. Kera G14 TaxID=2884264 RepID=UPI001D117A9C|nr:sucrase ferredoxin [Nocardioides sp. Kera G14]UDY24459.1 sucrase ferredoxin [Nocardioides sp. Kera G14]